MTRMGAVAVATFLWTANARATEIPSAETPKAAAPAGGVPAATIPPAQDAPYPGTLTLKIDLTDVERRVFNVREAIPVKPGPLTLLYPEWLPGNHAPRGPIDGLAGLTATASGRRLEWTRDPLNVYAFHVDVPPGASRLDLEFQFASPLVAGQGRMMVTPEIVGLQWNTVVLYPAGYYAARINVAAAVSLPEAWDFGCALDIDSRRGASVQFKHTTLETLVDSPLFAGRYFKSVDLDPGARIPVHLDIVADSPGSLEIKPEQLTFHRKLVQEAYALFGARHYDHYDLLLALSDHFGDIGLEHHRSSENKRSPGYFVEWDKSAPGRNLLPHEFSHSWNGKFRRPVGLATPNFNVPMQDTLLWVYEGLTNYLEGVLAARSGLWSADFTRQDWAFVAANMDRNRPGRAWRDLQDTTHQPIITARRPLSWLSSQRSEDYYPEGQLVWLDVDTKIRELSGDKRSLDDFARAFFGIDDGSTGPVTYTFDDVVRALNNIAAYDWEKFLTQRLHGHGPGAPLDGFARGGWKLVYTETPSDYVKGLEEQRTAADFAFSVGFSVSTRQNGQLTEVRWGSPAYDAGLTMGSTLVAVDGREYKAERLREAITAAKNTRLPIELIVKTLDRFRIVRIRYYEGLKYPRLERVEKAPDRLSAIMQPRS
jgi:predicted metalloprotease with PDZ domain